MREYTVITAPQDLLPQVVGELLSFAANPDLVDVVHGTHGREIHAHPEVAEAWYTARQQAEKAASSPAQRTAPASEVVQSSDTTAPDPSPKTVTESVTVGQSEDQKPVPVQSTKPTPSKK